MLRVGRLEDVGFVNKCIPWAWMEWKLEARKFAHKIRKARR